MDESLSPGAIKRCQHCGAAIGDALFVCDGSRYCCEACFLEGRAAPHSAERRLQTQLAEALVAALDARERETGLHSKRVACYTSVLAKRFTSDGEALQQVYWGALLHDIGKIGIPDEVLLKNGSLSNEEWEVMRQHPVIGHRILSGASSMAVAAQIVLTHEERYDGSGYPAHLAGAAIPLWSRLFAVIDTLDAITSDRPYRKAAAFDAAKAEIIAGSGRQFDPAAIDAFLAEESMLRAMAGMKCGDIKAHLF